VALEVNLPADKAFFTTQSWWYNASLEQPYYTWMNTGIKAKGNLNLFFPGTRHLVMRANMGTGQLIKRTAKKFPFYEQNNFGDINLTMFLENILILGLTGMMMIMEWRGMQPMMTKPEKKYGYGGFHSRA
jgi:hypothetical protein